MLPDSQTPIDVFCSYAHKDEALLEQLHVHLALLKRQKLISVWHDRQIVPGTDWSQAIDSRLAQSALILLLVSPDFIASDYCYEKEMTRALKRHEAKEARVIPIIARPCDWDQTPLAGLQCLPQDGLPITQWSDRDLAWQNVTAGLRRVLADLQLLAASAPTPNGNRATYWNVPYPPNPFFMGRDDQLRQLRDQLLQSPQPAAITQPQPISGPGSAVQPQDINGPGSTIQPQDINGPGSTVQSQGVNGPGGTVQPHAISGLGGIGKTQLAVHYAYRYRQEYTAILWARAETAEALTASFSALATLLDLPERDAREQQLIVRAVKTWLHTHSNWLLILDNADDLTLLPDLLLPPTPGGHILLTTRAWDMQRLARRIEINTLPPTQGATFLLRRASLLPTTGTLAQASPAEQSLALQITEALGGLPLALDQAGAYLEATGTSLQQYMQLYQRHRQALFQERRSLVPDHPDPLATTWSLSFQRVAERSPAAADLLRLCAYLAPDAIPEELLTQGTEEREEPLASPVADPLLFNQAIEALRAYSLVSRDPRAQHISIHRLVQAMLQDQLDAPQKAHWAEQAVRAVAAAFPDVEHKVWPQCERLLPHALVVANLVEQYHFVFPAASYLLNQAGTYLQTRGLYKEAEPLYQRALRIYEEQLGSEHPDTATSLNNLAVLYRAQGRYEEAEPLYQRALRICEEQLGGEHPDTATSLNNLARLYRAQGRYEEAEPLYERALRIREEQLGGEHPDTATSLNNLAGLYRAQGRYEEAEPLYERALRIREEQLGGEHPHTAQSLGNLAELYRAQRRYEEAEPLYERALKICEEQLGGEHPDTATSLNNLALLYRAQGRYEEAEPLYERALSICRQGLGEKHSNTVVVRENYASLLRVLGRDEEATALEAG